MVIQFFRYTELYLVTMMQAAAGATELYNLSLNDVELIEQQENVG